MVGIANAIVGVAGVGHNKRRREAVAPRVTLENIGRVISVNAGIKVVVRSRSKGDKAPIGADGCIVRIGTSLTSEVTSADQLCRGQLQIAHKYIDKFTTIIRHEIGS